MLGRSGSDQNQYLDDRDLIKKHIFGDSVWEIGLCQNQYLEDRALIKTNVWKIGF
jgi:hypothetical protein